MILKSYKYRLYPNQNQKILLEKHFGCNRYVYNWALETKIKEYKENNIKLSEFDLNGRLTKLKKDLSWLYEVSNPSLQLSIRNMDNAFKHFLKWNKKFPKFKSKTDKQSFQFSSVTSRINWSNKKLIIPKFNEGIKLKIDRKFDGKIKTCTISKTSTNKYFVSILVEEPIDIPIKSQLNFNNSIGIDLGIKDFLITDSGEKIENPKYLKNELKRLQILQRRASKKKKGSNNRKKANLKVAKQHEKIANKRKDFLHKLSSRLISENQTICLEDLSVKNMVKNHKLAQAISDVSWGEFVRQLEYKADWYGVNILKCNRFDATSKTCTCGSKNDELELSDRTWICKSCGQEHDRDILAANNIKRFAFKNSGQGMSSELVEKTTLVDSMKQEL